MSDITVSIGTAAENSGWFDSQIVGAVLQSLAVALAAWFGFRAITKQIRETESRRLKSELLEQSLDSARTLSDAHSGLSGLLTRLMLEVDVHALATAVGINSPIPSIRFPRIMEAYDTFSNATLNLIFLIEARQFIDPRLLVFRDALLSVMHDGGKIFYRDFPTVVMRALPTDKPDGGIFHYDSPSVETAKIVKDLCMRVLEVAANGQCVAADFQVEMQNLLASELFGHKIEHRVPLDAKHKVFRLETAAEQRSWLASETDWGRECAKIDAEMLQNLVTLQEGSATPPSPPAPAPRP